MHDPVVRTFIKEGGFLGCNLWLSIHMLGSWGGETEFQLERFSGSHSN